MNQIATPTLSAETAKIDASCRISLLALFGGAALWLVVGLALGLAAVMSFHKPDIFSHCPWLMFGRAQAASNDLLLYGFAIPAALGVMLWIFCRLSQAPVALPLVSIAAANLWHLGILCGTLSILAGDTTGFTWLEYPRAVAVLLFSAFLLFAIVAAATFGYRRKRELYPAHWFLFAALLAFPWIYATANLLLLSWPPPRGVVQAIIDWWFGNNLIFVWLALIGVGTAFYFLPKLSGKPLANRGYVIFAFLTLILFATWTGIPVGAPVPAWLPILSSVAAGMTLVPLFAILVITFRTLSGASAPQAKTAFNFIKFGMAAFIGSGLLYVCRFCPHYSKVLEFTWFDFGQTQLQLLGFASMILFGAMYEILPRIMETPLPFPKFAKIHFGIAVIGILLFVLPLIVGGANQGHLLADPKVPFATASAAAIKYLRISTAGELLVLLGTLLFALNIFVMTLKWKLGLLKSALAAINAPLETSEVKS